MTMSIVLIMLLQNCKHSCRKKASNPSERVEKVYQKSWSVNSLNGSLFFRRKCKQNQITMTAGAPTPCCLGFSSVILLGQFHYGVSKLRWRKSKKAIMRDLGIIIIETSQHLLSPQPMPGFAINSLWVLTHLIFTQAPLGWTWGSYFSRLLKMLWESCWNFANCISNTPFSFWYH